MLDADTGKFRRHADLLAACWNTPLVAGDHAYICDEDGDVAIFRLFPDATGAPPPRAAIAEINMGQSIYSTPVVSRGVLYIATKNRLYAIEEPKKK
jgi:hypothetical protein